MTTVLTFHSRVRPAMFAALIAIGALATLPATAETVTEKQVVTAPSLHPDSASAARKLLSRLHGAADAVCGAPAGSLADVRRAVRASSCWHDAMADVVRRVDSPLLTALYQGDKRFAAR